MVQRSPAANGVSASDDYVHSQVFYSPGARRGWALLTILVLVGSLVAIGVRWAQVQTSRLLPTAARYNTSVNFPSQVANAVRSCAKTAGQYGANGAMQVPVIGTGVFQRVVRIVQDGDAAYAVDPFSGKIVRPLTALEMHATRKCGYAVDEFGTVPRHTLILTYDDGPSAQWTPRLLGILDAYHVHATFFNIGVNILANQQVFRTVLAHGNAIGNHTLDHPRLWLISATSARNELTENARIMAEVAHYQTRIWRTPYGGGDPVSVGNDILATLVGQQLGFTEVGFTNDTSDYALVGKEIPPPPLSSSPDSPGMVIIMHDGGGNRSSTMTLSKKVIREAQSRGYKFMTVPQLLAEQPGYATGPIIGTTKPTPVDYAGYWLRAYSPVFVRWYMNFIRYMTIILIVVSGLILVGAALDRWLSYRRPPQWHPKELGILIPCWKESKVIRNTVERVLAAGAGLPFPLRIVLVDDGSADNDPSDTTWEILRQLAAEHPGQVTAVQQHNGGKARALNYGLRYITSEFVVVMDADTIPKDSKSFLHIVRWFGDPRVGAVAGWTKAGDRGEGWRQRMIAEFQSAEYDLGIALVRSVQNLSNSIVIVPGAFSAFRTEWLREVGYLPDRVVAEDAEAPQRMRQVRPRMLILQDLTSVAYTEVPLTFAVLRRQWRRWTIGVLQTLWEHREIFYRMDKYQVLTLQWWFALYGAVVPPLFLPVSYVMVAYGLATGTLGGIYYYPLLFIVFRVVQTLGAMLILRTWMNPLVAIWYRIINDPLQMYLTVVCFWMILTGRMPARRKIWSAVPRSGALASGGTTSVGSAGIDAPDDGVQLRQIQLPEATEVAEPVEVTGPAEVTESVEVTGTVELTMPAEAAEPNGIAETVETAGPSPHS